MDVVEAMRNRKSIRAFEPRPVPEQLLREVLQVAIRAPSSGNSQPWDIVVVAGEILRRIGDENVRRFRAGMEIKGKSLWTESHEIFRQRHMALGVELYRLMGIGKEDRDKRRQWQEQGLRYFGAPAALFLCVERSLDALLAGFNLGLLAQSICLSALSYGLGTCIELQGVAYPEVISQYAGIPDSKMIVVSIA
ncbi:MAG: nitroreductase, partial [Dehalococcoidia bacterium]|nr:nitroreductase [Dehalococcoidia bacterium]